MAKRDPLTRLLALAERDEDSGCLLWAGAKHASGYGHFWYEGRAREAHVVSYTLQVGPVPDGWDVDHECHNRAECTGGVTCTHRLCIEPTHLVARSHQENVLASPVTIASRNRAKTHCPRNHELAGDNLVARPSGKRECRTCANARQRKVA